MKFEELKKKKAILDAILLLGNLYNDQDKLGKAKKMYERTLREKEEAFDLKHTSTLITINNLGLLYTSQGKLAKAKKMYERTLKEYENAIDLRNVEIYKLALNTM